MKGIWNEFRTFAVRGNVIDLAVGVVIGTAFNKIVTSLVNDILMPPIGMLAGKLDFSNLFINLSSTKATTLSEAQAQGLPTLNYGLFINTIVHFVIVAFAVFLLVKQINRMKREEASPPPSPPEDVLLLREIRDLLKVKNS